MECYRTNDRKFETLVIKYQRGDITITAIGIIHLGHAEYYQAIQEIINLHGEGFYEGIRKSHGLVSDDKKRFVKVLQNALSYEKLAELLGLKTQAGCLRFPENWRNVDVALDELINQMSLEELEAQERTEADLRRKIEEIEKNERKKAAWTLRTVYSLVKRNQTEGQCSLSGVRDYQLHPAVKERCQGHQKKSIGVVYGSNHLDSLDCYLSKNGFKISEINWLVAIDINRIAGQYIGVMFGGGLGGFGIHKQKS